MERMIRFLILFLMVASPTYGHDLVAKHLADYATTFYLGEGAAVPIASFQDVGDSTNVRIFSPDHKKSNGDRINIIKSYYYIGTYTVANASDDHFTIAATWELSETGAMWVDAYSLSGSTCEMKAYDDAAGSNEIVDLNCTVADAAGGKITASATDTVINALSIDTYYYDLIEIESDANRKMMVSGRFYVKGRGATDRTVTDTVVNVNDPAVSITIVGAGSGGGGGSVEGTAVLSTGEAGGVKYLREDGDGTSSWQVPAGSGTMTTVKENDVQLGGADIVTLDFLGADFDLAESPDTEVQVVIAAAIARDSEITTDIATHAGVADAHGSWEPAGITESDISDLSHFDADPDSLTGDTVDDNKVDAAIIADLSATYEPAGITESDISDLSHTTDTGPSPDCTGTTTYQDGEGNCDDISSVYEPAGITESDISDLTHDGTGTDDQTAAEVSVDTSAFGVNFSNDASHDTAQELFDIVDDLSLGGGAGDVTAASTLTDNAIVTGDGGVKGVQDSAVTIDDNGLVTVPTGATAGLFFGDGDTGFYEGSANVIYVNSNGSTRWVWNNSGAFYGNNTNAPILYASTPSATDPPYAFLSDDDTGFTRVGANIAGIAAGGVSVAQFSGNAGEDSAKINSATATSVGLNIEAAAASSVDLIQLTSNGGTAGDLFKVENDGDVFLAKYLFSGFGIKANNYASYTGDVLFHTSGQNLNIATSYVQYVNIATGTYNNTSGSEVPVSILPIYNQASGTAANTDLLINRTETAVGSGAQLLADFQVGGTTKANIDNTGLPTFAALTNCDTIDTDANGVFSCGTDDGGSETNSLETLTTGILADEIPMGTGTNAVTFKAMPSTGTNGCSGSGDKLLYNTTTDTWSCGADAGAGGGMTSFTVQADDTNTMTVTDGETVDIAGGLGLTTTAATGSPEQLTVDYDHSLTLAGNPALAVDECVPVATLGGGGMICEGSTANTNEQLYLFPDLDGADTTQEITLNDATQTLTNKTIDATNTVTINASDITDASANGQSLITAANYAAMRTLLDLEAGTDFNAYSANMDTDSTDDAIAGGAFHDGFSDFVAGEHYTQANITTVGTVTVGSVSAIEADPTALLTAGTDNVKDTHLDWGTGASQVSADDVPDGATNAIITLTQETNFGTAYSHSQATGTDPHAVAADTLTLTNKTIDADGAGNSITNIENADIKAGAAISVSKTALVAGRSLTLTTDTVDADAELYTETEGFVLESPVDADAFLFWKSTQAITITDIDCITGAATSAVIDIQECSGTGTGCATVDATITCDSDGAADDGTFTNGSIDAGDWLNIDIGTVTGTVEYVAVTITYTIND